MKIHILGVAGTFMGGVAQLAKAKGFEVSGSDKAIYPPMSTQLEQAGIDVLPLEDVSFLQQAPNQVVIGNALSRGQAAVEAVLNAQQPYTSGPQWLAENILQDRWVVAIAGTHGKTTTSSMVAWILEHAGLNPGFLIGGVPENFGVSARLGDSPFFVVEADEYDSAFFDKRSKFVHYHPRTCVLNNLEFDHADIFPNLEAIQTQFHHLVRTIPGNGLIIAPQEDEALQAVLKKGCWTPVAFSAKQPHAEADWYYQMLNSEGSAFEVFYQGEPIGEVHWSLLGAHNVQNALHAVAAAVHCGVPPTIAVEALSEFKGVKRRLSLVGEEADIRIYDDFAHHPTAIRTTLQGIRQSLAQASLPAAKNARIPSPAGESMPTKRLIAVFEPRSNTMRLGIHKETLPKAFQEADAVFAFIDPEWHWSLDASQFGAPLTVAANYEDLLEQLLEHVQPGDEVVFMSNGSFGGLPVRFQQALRERRA
jgi:UDP-N-acetylmuramate: L-alanyl-gamma-D-glutamyl-meso-diaminopimelate ligase